jgi:hypothetical protein
MNSPQILMVPIRDAKLPLDLTKKLPRFPLLVTLHRRIAATQSLRGLGLGETTVVQLSRGSPRMAAISFPQSRIVPRATTGKAFAGAAL